MYQSKIFIDGDHYAQYRINDDGKGRGELWRRLDQCRRKTYFTHWCFERFLPEYIIMLMVLFETQYLQDLLMKIIIFLCLVTK